MISVCSNNLSWTWGNAFLHTLNARDRKIMHLVMNIEGLKGRQRSEILDPSISDALDTKLAELDSYGIRTVAETIFPLSLMDRQLSGDAQAQALYDTYLRIFPKIKSYPANYNGTYFHRFIHFQPAGADKSKANQKIVNQLADIIYHYRKGKRKKNGELTARRSSAMQLSAFGPGHEDEEALESVADPGMPLPVFDPTRDITAALRRGFPCLQQVSLAVDAETQTLHMTALYADQYLISKAYGNLVGLYDLGVFLAQQMELELDQITCIATVGRVETSKKKVADLAQFCRQRLLEAHQLDTGL